MQAYLVLFFLVIHQVFGATNYWYGKGDMLKTVAVKDQIRHCCSLTGGTAFFQHNCKLYGVGRCQKGTCEDYMTMRTFGATCLFNDTTLYEPYSNPKVPYMDAFKTCLKSYQIPFLNTYSMNESFAGIDFKDINDNGNCEPLT